MQTLIQDLRYGARTLLKKPGFTLIAIITLGLGIGANTAIFSLVNMVMLRPLPVSQPDRIVEVTPLFKGQSIGAFSYPTYKDFRDKNEVFDGLAAYIPIPMSLSRNGVNERVWGYLASGNYFDLLGVRAIKGRMFTQEEDLVPGANHIAVVSYGCWQRRFGADPNLVGKTIKLNGHDFTIVGVAPEEFRGTVVVFDPEIYTPMMMAKQIAPGDSKWLENRGAGGILAFGRLKQGVTATQARESLNLLMAEFAREYQDFEGMAFSVTPAGLAIPLIRFGAMGFAGVLMATVALVLLIACVNLANLLLARAAQRRKEIAIRLSLGAGRARVVRQLLTESVALSLAGGAVGWLIALWLLELVEAFMPSIDFNLLIDLRPDWRVVIFTLAVSFITGALFGLAPALQTSKVDLILALKDDAGLGGYRRSRFRNGLVVAQVALSLLLLIGAGLIVRSLQQTLMVGPGFEVENRITMSVDLGMQGYDEPRGREFYKQLFSRVESLPGVRAASYISALPLNLDMSAIGIYVEGQQYTRASDLHVMPSGSAWPRYFETMGIPLLEGRDFTMLEDKEESRVVIVNETFARRFWPGQNPIGKHLSKGGPDKPRFEVVGVAKDGKYGTLGEAPQSFVYFPMAREYASEVALVVNTSVEPQSMIKTIRREVERLDSSLPLYDVKTMREHTRFLLFPLQAGAWVAGGFALLALLLAGLGIYGVMAYTVSQRTREIGVRMALGASGGDVLRLVVRQGTWLALVGLAIGLVGSLALTRLMSSVLYGVSATDVVTFAGVTLLLGSVVLIACYLPARRAAKVDPMIALRCE
ncbi:MAG TPA: ABC transporter permease [Blastocatellia bacterium]|nr:ABC transporter permease [Blastocatellia bacterium]